MILEECYSLADIPGQSCCLSAEPLQKLWIWLNGETILEIFDHSLGSKGLHVNKLLMWGIKKSKFLIGRICRRV